jgi:hypothetical protein
MPPNSMQWSGALKGHTYLPAAFKHCQGYVNRPGTDKLFPSDAPKHVLFSYTSPVTSRSVTATSDPPVANISLGNFEIEHAAR